MYRGSRSKMTWSLFVQQIRSLISPGSKSPGEWIHPLGLPPFEGHGLLCDYATFAAA